ncbi:MULTISPECIES: NAD(P)/FAD-dependent oxidoreductase [Prochlorococcus]|uniref:Thioredoxin reductase n=1 Tax=Prochlorococcus marinus (strain SARG / CCMP1375 / SS120) TaxID=167539 RepID=Q7VDX6_PROMA|nr:MULTISPECIES: FAD-dependent oxidoreductase [Prochlorococcus]AAP99285.1 Thioredoxin reductase [Prochlorococcus marinus subsp. marinus str. CCMP1375]KGG18601.1 Thioredoxin reductase [Prochlorococcus marinus str. SS2]KGG22874.1 Thioredoxin reductase [Prochlorococcus marinus str. SS35]KGG32750.1 Thioredoxin reductase [Prochlorococcus marinus str. SS51]KGG37068.1 Thioredoxin reductase [Prochlorococcus sp. SS52]
METIEADVVIVGGGPAGCSCALYSSRADLKTVILDKNPAVGALAITHQIANYPGVPTDISGEDLLNLMRDQCIQYGTDYRRAQVFGVDVNGDWKTVYTPEGTFKGRALVLASGAMGRPASFKGEAEFLGRGVSYCATCDGAFYKGREVAVVGVNKEAIEEAQVLTKFASIVHWITSSDPKQEDVHAQTLINEPNVRHWSRTRLLQIEGADAGVTGITVKNRIQEDKQLLPVEGVFVYMAGSKPITDFLGDQIALKEDGGVVVDDFMSTTSEGVWAIGDIRNTPFKQAVVAASDGCIAAMAIDRFLNSRKSIRVDWVHS